ncbi:MAG: 3-phosphoserine/phosphohydroxythreonine transaminase [Betaproteobacteria bacterium]|nr:3-phosphoserine/phosphohydroxythreonine transaminase [Betaproteobacteria bacterium]
MSRIFNFSAGPAMLPAEVLSRAGDEILDWHGSGMSVMEMSHRGKEFIGIAAEAEKDLRELLAVPANYRVLFLAGGATLQFAQVPLNLLAGKGKADYVATGEWSNKAIKEAKAFCDVHIAASSEDKKFTYAPKKWDVRKDAAYVHFCSNETIGGVEYHTLPQSPVPIVADASSHFMSRAIDVSKYGLIYAGAQKNVGPAGLTIVIVREDLIGKAEKHTPSVMDYKKQAEAESMLNTPPTYSMYIAGLVFKWLKALGGIAEIERRNIAKAKVLYDFLDGTKFYGNPVAREDRSRMNVPFTLRDAKLDEEFLKGASKAGMVQLKGHRSVGGMRASIYNAMPIEGVQRLVEYMKEFERKHG